ncbi:MAG TPA: site-specific integrase, partial [Puia sp.]|nr:site-specific integrase [Puia sp.]
MIRPVHNWRNKKNASKLYPIHIRVTIERKSKYFPIELPKKVSSAEWSDKPNIWVKNTHPFAFEINNTIREKLDSLHDLVKRYYSANKSLTFQIISKELGKNGNINSFNGYFEEIIKNPPETFSPRTIKRYQVTLKHVNAFNSKITFNELSGELFQQFKKYCEKKNLVGTTINGYFNALKKVVYWARKDNHINKNHQESIFEDVHIKINKTRKDHLEIEEIREWRNYQFEERLRFMERDRDLFLLQIYTGFYYSDLKELMKSDLKKDPEHGYYLNASRYKNGNLAIIPLWKFPKAIDLVRKYTDNNSEEKYLLSREHFVEDQVYNRKLKDIAKKLGWDRNVY